MKALFTPVLRALAWAVPLVGVLLITYAYAVDSNRWHVELHEPRWLFVLAGAVFLWLLASILLRPLRATPGASDARLFFSRGADLARAPRGMRARLLELPGGLRVASVVLLTLALTRPQRVDVSETIEMSGIDIVLSLDLSGSMRGADLKPTRLEAAKSVMTRFIEQRPTDRIGLVVFGREAFPALAPTLDHTVVMQTVGQMTTETLSEESHAGTAIGDGLGAALAYLSRSDAKSKTVVLLTDGANNAGHLDPMHAAQLAKTLHAQVYTILVGQADNVPVITGQGFGGPTVQMQNFPIDPDLLQNIARETSGEFFRATDQASLDGSFKTILDNLQKSTIASRGQSRTELFPYLLVPAALLIALELLLSTTLLRRFP